jgi:hypothetical protein
VAVIVIATATIIGVAAQGGQKVVAPPDATEIALLRSRALAFAAQDGEPKPVGGTIVPTTRARINALNAGTEVNTDQDVYVVTLHGHFVDTYASVPRGRAEPSGQLLILVYDAKTNELTDYMLGDYPIDATPLGTPVPLGTS